MERRPIHWLRPWKGLLSVPACHRIRHPESSQEHTVPIRTLDVNSSAVGADYLTEFSVVDPVLDNYQRHSPPLLA